MGIMELRANFEGHSIVLQRNHFIFSSKGPSFKLYIDGEVVDSIDNLLIISGEHPLLRGRITHDSNLHIVETKINIKFFGKNTYYIYRQ